MLQPLLAFYDSGYKAGGFDTGIRDALAAILASPWFLYRIESGDANSTHTLTDVELASRLSFFLWGSIPDDELLTAAIKGNLGQPAQLEAQVRRMLADPKAKSLSTDFGFQWLNMAKLAEIEPDARLFPNASGTLDVRPLLRRELDLFLDSVLRSDQPVTALLTADYTYLNETLAQIYGIPTVKGGQFQRVTPAGFQALWTAGQGRSADGHRVPQPHGTGAARRMDTGSHSRYAALPATRGCRRPEARGRKTCHAARALRDAQ